MNGVSSYNGPRDDDRWLNSYLLPLPAKMTNETINADIVVAWNWPPDEPFMKRILRECERNGIVALLVGPSDVAGVYDKVRDGRLMFRYFMDRASDESDAFIPLANTALAESTKADGGNGVRFINRTDLAKRAADKATMHLEFITHGIHVPYTVILPPLHQDTSSEVPTFDFDKLGIPFVIKPANTTGGGVGVFMEGRTIEHIQFQRSQHPRDKYLVQKRVAPVYLSDARAWFRVYYAFGETFLCWWDDQTHIYEAVLENEEEWFGLQELRGQIRTIASVCGLDFFSSEFAQVANGSFVSVDYVNELCDMRSKSSTPNGVPDALISWFCARLVSAVGERPSSQN